MEFRKNTLFRSLLVFMLAFVMIFVTACGDAEDPKDTDKPNSGDNTTAVFAGGWPYETVPTGHFNMFIANAIELKYFRELHQLPLATYRADTEEYVPMLAESWELADDKKSLKITLRDDAEWMSGEKFTSKDVVATFLTYRLVGDSVWNYIDKVEAISDTEVSFDIQEGTTMLYRYILRKPMVDYETYGEYSDRLAKLIEEGKDNTSSEWESLVNDFTNFRPDKVNFDKILVYNGDVADLTPLVLNKEVDYLTHQFPAASMESFIDAGYSTIQLEGSDGIGMYINEDVKPLDKKEVRKALAHIIDRNRVADFALPGVTRGTKYLSGLGDQMTEDWADASKLVEYDVNAEKASDLLESAGLTKKDDTWYLEDGKEFTLSLQAPSSWSDAATAANEISQQLTAFGIKTTFDGIDPNSRQANIDDGKYDLALSFFGTGKPHAAFAFETALILSNANVSKGLSYPMEQETEIAGKVDLEKLITQATEGWDKDAQREKVEKIVYTVNETVPYIPIYTKWSNNLSSGGMRTDWGSDDGLYLNSAGDDNFTVIKILNGELKPINK